MIKYAVMFILISTLCACASSRSTNLAHVDTTNIRELESLHVNPKPGYERVDIGLGSLKVKSLQESAMSIGAQGGLAWASQRMNKRLTEDAKYLDTIFNFDAMVLSHGVIPPVLEAGNFELNQDDPNTIRVADRTYRIIQQARFATTPPNWREYIWLSYSKPTLPDKSLLPRNKYEQKIWRDAINAGWEKGIQQATAIFQQNLARLKRDFQGMVIYRKLLQEKMISAPFVARTELGITGNGGDMRINDQVLRIVDLPKLQTNSKRWRAVVIKNGN